jgi:hypothetical protein
MNSSETNSGMVKKKFLMVVKTGKKSQNLKSLITVSIVREYKNLVSASSTVKGSGTLFFIKYLL